MTTATNTTVSVVVTIPPPLSWTSTRKEYFGLQVQIHKFTYANTLVFPPYSQVSDLSEPACSDQFDVVDSERFWNQVEMELLAPGVSQKVSKIIKLYTYTHKMQELLCKIQYYYLHIAQHTHTHTHARAHTHTRARVRTCTHTHTGNSTYSLFMFVVVVCTS